MNERIRELAEQAGFVDKGSSHTMYIDFDHEKFAQLIVRECAKIATNPYLNDEESYYGNEFAKAIMKHFGVE